MDTRKNIIKVMVLGDSGVGKTAILQQYVKRTFNNSYKVTLGSDFLTQELRVEGQKVVLQIWDTAGQEQYRSLSISYYRGSDACVLVFDVTDKLSFHSLDTWVTTFTEQLPEDKRAKYPMLVVGNKVDKDNRQVPREQALKWCQDNDDLPYYDVSAKTRDGIDSAFAHIARLAIKKAQATRYFLLLIPQRCRNHSTRPPR